MPAAARPKCTDKRPCFARTRDRKCKALIITYDGEGRMCPFCKKKRTVVYDGWEDDSRVR